MQDTDYLREELKAEAVKWVKELKEDREPLNAVLQSNFGGF